MIMCNKKLFWPAANFSQFSRTVRVPFWQTLLTTNIVDDNLDCTLTNKHPPQRLESAQDLELMSKITNGPGLV